MQVDYIPGWLTKPEGELLAYFAQQADGPILEIGSFKGKSTIYMGLATKQKIYAVDPHAGETHQGKQSFSPTYKTFLANIKKFGIEKKVVPMRMTSATANKKWRKKIAMLHIDGLHEYRYAKQDLQLWLPYLSVGGVVVCHDAFGEFPDVFRAVREEIFSKGYWRYLGVLDGQIFAVKGKPRNLWEKFNVARSKFFLAQTKDIWENKSLSERVRTILVNRVCKVGILNKFMFREVLDKMGL